MSRTFRFKNYYAVNEQHSRSNYTHEFGRYTQRDCICIRPHCVYVFRAPTKQDLWRAFKRSHADHKFQYGNNPCFRKVDNRSMKTLHARELSKWVNDPGHEPQFVLWSRCKEWWD